MIKEDAPNVSFEETWRGYDGTLWCGDQEIADVSNFSIRRPKYDPSENWSLRLSIPDDAGTVQTDADSCDPADLRFEGETYSGSSTVAHLVGVAAPMRPVDRTPPEAEFRAVANKLDVDVETLPEPPTAQRISVVLSDHALTRQEERWLATRHTGEIEPLADIAEEQEGEARDTEGEPLYWPTRYGRGELWLRYRWESPLVGGHKSTLRIAEPRLEIQVSRDNLSRDIPNLIQKLRDDLYWLLKFLSLLSRRHVRCLQIMVESEWGKAEPRQHRVSRRIWRASPSERHQILDPIILHPAALPATALLKLKGNARDLPHSDALASSIGFLVEAFRAEFIEAQWTAAFTALETVVGALAETHGLTSPLEQDEYYRLKGKLEKVIRQFDPKQGELNENDREDLTRMLGALRRRPFFVRASKVIETTGVEWKDLWPEDTNLEDAIRSAYGRRSDLIHSGQLPDDRDWYIDQFRMHALAERIVLSELELPSDWITTSPYRHCTGLPEQPL